VKEIELTQGYLAIVDDEDFERINAFNWRALPSSDNIIYGARTEQKDNKVTNIMMHRLILGVTDKSLHVDHKNGNGLDNRKENLRLVTRNQNMRNLTRIRVNNTSGYRGVCFEKSSGKWMAYIYIDGKQKKLGRHLDPKDAARAFDNAAREIFGEYCGKLNFED
jgi:hypothetical protein